MPPFLKCNSAASILGAVASPFLDITQQHPRVNIPWTDPYKYYLPKQRGHRRVLSIPNPLCQLLLSQYLCTNWSSIQSKCSRSSLSRSSPTVKNDVFSRHIAPRLKQSDLIADRLRYRATASHLLKIDIANFFPSVYTHSLAWAIHGKAFIQVPANMRDRSLVGNQIDLAIQACQSGQTNGIPVGPDTSLVLAELSLSLVDKDIGRLPGLVSGFRYYDDYELYFSSPADAQRAIATVEQILSRTQLSVNPSKTVIESLPLGFQPAWLSSLRRYPISRYNSIQQRDLHSIFSIAFSAQSHHPEDRPINYLLARMRHVRLASEACWKDFEALLRQCMLADPTSIVYVSQIFIDEHEYEIDKGALSVSLDNLISDKIGLMHTHELAWALWMYYSLSIRLCSELAEKIRDSGDPMLLAILGLLADRSLVAISLTASMNRLRRQERVQFSSGAIFAYEAVRRGWGYARYRDCVDASDLFAHLLANDGAFMVDSLEQADSNFVLDRMGDYEGEDQDDDDGEDFPGLDDDSDDDPEY